MFTVRFNRKFIKQINMNTVNSIRQAMSKSDLRKFISFKIKSFAKITRIGVYSSTLVTFTVESTSGQIRFLNGFKVLSAVVQNGKLFATYSLHAEEIKYHVDEIEYYQRNENIAKALNYPTITLKNK